jgi:hypothetical protein
VAVVNPFLEHIEKGNVPSSIPYAGQLVGLRRLEWLATHFLTSHLHDLEETAKEAKYDTIDGAGGDLDTNKDSDSTGQDNSTKSLVSKLFTESRGLLAGLQWPHWHRMIKTLKANPLLKDPRGETLLDALGHEIVEEISFPSRFLLLFPLDESTWCPIAQELTKQLCEATASHTWSSSKGITEDLAVLKGIYTRLTLEAADKVKNPESLADLALDRGVWERFDLELRTTAKNAPPGSSCVVTCYRGGTKPEPVLINDDTTVSNTTINTNWYLIHQVAHVACALAITHFPDDIDGVLSRWVEYICPKLGIPSSSVYHSLQHGIHLAKHDKAFIRPQPISIDEKQKQVKEWLRDLRGEQLGGDSSAECRTQRKSKSIGAEVFSAKDEIETMRELSQRRQNYLQQMAFSEQDIPDGSAATSGNFSSSDTISTSYHGSKTCGISREAERKRRKLPDGSMIPKTLPPRNPDGSYPVPKVGRHPPNLVWHPYRGIWVPPHALHSSNMTKVGIHASLKRKLGADDDQIIKDIEDDHDHYDSSSKTTKRRRSDHMESPIGNEEPLRDGQNSVPIEPPSSVDPVTGQVHVSAGRPKNMKWDRLRGLWVDSSQSLSKLKEPPQHGLQQDDLASQSDPESQVSPSSTSSSANSSRESSPRSSLSPMSPQPPSQRSEQS